MSKESSELIINEQIVNTVNYSQKAMREQSQNPKQRIKREQHQKFSEMRITFGKKQIQQLTNKKQMSIILKLEKSDNQVEAKIGNKKNKINQSQAVLMEKLKIQPLWITLDQSQKLFGKQTILQKQELLKQAVSKQKASQKWADIDSEENSQEIGKKDKSSLNVRFQSKIATLLKKSTQNYYETQIKMQKYKYKSSLNPRQQADRINRLAKLEYQYKQYQETLFYKGFTQPRINYMLCYPYFCYIWKNTLIKQRLIKKFEKEPRPQVRKALIQQAHYIFLLTKHQQLQSEMDQWIFGKTLTNIWKSLKDVIRKIYAIIKSLINSLSKLAQTQKAETTSQCEGLQANEMKQLYLKETFCSHSVIYSAAQNVAFTQFGETAQCFKSQINQNNEIYAHAQKNKSQHLIKYQVKQSQNQQVILNEKQNKKARKKSKQTQKKQNTKLDQDLREQVQTDNQNANLNQKLIANLSLIIEYFCKEHLIKQYLIDSTSKKQRVHSSQLPLQSQKQNQSKQSAMVITSHQQQLQLKQFLVEKLQQLKPMASKTSATHNLMRSKQYLEKEEFLGKMQKDVQELLNYYLKYQHIGKLLLALQYLEFNEKLISMILENFIVHDQLKKREFDGFQSK